MRYLLYCIFRSPEYQEPGPIRGVDRQPVITVGKNGLSAAVSSVVQPVLTPDISRILAYKEVIESFHRDRTVIPMRFGSLFHEESEILRLLEERAEQYASLLNELEGCVEMGIRIIISDFGLRPRFQPGGLPGRRGGAYAPEGSGQSPIPHPTSHIPPRKSPTSGRAYLAARKEHYDKEEQFTKEMEKIAKQFRAAFTGLFLKCKTEYPQSPINNPQSTIPNQQSAILSLYFLVPRRCVESFQQVFRRMGCGESKKVLLSGPWPPYNFVLPEPSTGREGLLLAKKMVGKEEDIR